MKERYKADFEVAMDKDRASLVIYDGSDETTVKAAFFGYEAEIIWKMIEGFEAPIKGIINAGDELHALADSTEPYNKKRIRLNAASVAWRDAREKLLAVFG
jgi:hypothetical protein